MAVETYTDADPESLNSQMAEFAPQIRYIFDLHSRIASGSFGTVYKANWKCSNRSVGLKHILPTCKPSRSINEIRCLQVFGGKHNVCAIISTFRFDDHIFIVMPFYEHNKFQTYFHTMNATATKFFMSSLFSALKHVHSYGIIHRDVKPSNFIYCYTSKRHVLIDFGLVSASTDMNNNILVGNPRYDIPAKPKGNNLGKSSIENLEKICLHAYYKVCNHCISKGKKVAMRAGTAGYRGPEILMRYQYQTTKADIWSAGVIFLSILTSCYPFFKSSSDLGHLVQIAVLLGSEAMKNAAKDIDIKFNSSGTLPGHNLSELCKQLRKHTCNGDCSSCIPESAYELLSRCLDPNPNTRITAAEALNMKYFL